MSGERGAVTIYAVVIGSLLGMVAMVIVQASTLVRLQHEVTKAADLSALAATQASVRGGDGCAAAKDLAHRNHARLVRCRMDFDVASVTTRGESRSVWGKHFGFERKARAAPLDYVGIRDSG